MKRSSTLILLVCLASGLAVSATWVAFLEQEEGVRNPLILFAGAGLTLLTVSALVLMIFPKRWRESLKAGGFLGGFVALVAMVMLLVAE